MRLEHYVKLYRREAIDFYSSIEQKEVVRLLLDRFTINDWKDFEKTISNKGESS